MHLPKVVTGDRHVIEEQVRQLIHYIPRLKYCPHHVERYMIASLETLVKSIREVNLSIDTRLNCFVWNL